MRLVPQAVHEETVIDQLAVLDIGKGRLVAFDYDLMLASEDVGRKGVFGLVAFLPDIKPADTSEFEVDGWIPEVEVKLPFDSDTDWSEQFERRRQDFGVSNEMCNRLLTGRIVELGDPEPVLLEIAGGTVGVYLNPGRQRVSLGEYIGLFNFRLDLREVALEAP